VLTMTFASTFIGAEEVVKLGGASRTGRAVRFSCTPAEGSAAATAPPPVIGAEVLAVVAPEDDGGMEGMSAILV